MRGQARERDMDIVCVLQGALQVCVCIWFAFAGVGGGGGSQIKSISSVCVRKKECFRQSVEMFNVG